MNYPIILARNLTKNPKKGLLGYATRFQRQSVQKTGSCGTEEIFGAKKKAPTVRDASSVREFFSVQYIIRWI